MHPANRDDLKRFIAPYLAIEHDGSDWRDGRFQIREGRTQRDAKERTNAIPWSVKGTPRPIPEVARELEDRIDLLTQEGGHERLFVTAFYKGESNPDAWRQVADGERETSSGVTAWEGALSDSAKRDGYSTLAIANARVTIELSSRNAELMSENMQLTRELGRTAAELGMSRMLLEGALSAAPERRIEEVLRAYAPHVGPALGSVIASLGAAASAHLAPESASVPSEPGAAIDHHLAALRTHALAFAAAAQASPAALTPERQAAAFELYQMITAWIHPAAEPSEPLEV